MIEDQCNLIEKEIKTQNQLVICVTLISLMELFLILSSFCFPVDHYFYGSFIVFLSLSIVCFISVSIILLRNHLYYNHDQL